MRIGIITFWDSQDNYGQLLQCYALQRYLKNLGHDPYLIRYKPRSKSTFSLSKLKPRTVINFLKLHLGKHDTKEEIGVSRDFNSFRSHISYSEREYIGIGGLMEENWTDTDAFICGSDQIWSPKPLDDLRAYFLNFTPFQKKRIAYAPSFGRERIDEGYAQILPELIRNFDAIGVREASGVDIARRAGKEAELVCDPTLLLDASVYREEFILPSEKKNSCFCYFINWHTDIDQNELIKFCNEHNLEPKLFCTKGYKSEIKQHSLQSPEEWLKELSASHFSAVNSFHGLVFSILFKVPFAVYILKGEQAAMNGRIHSLLQLLGLSDRIVSKTNPIGDVYARTIDWEQIDKKLTEIKKASFKFLDDALEESQVVNLREKQNICFLTSGAVHHYYGGLDRVTEILANRFAEDGHKVYYLSAFRREKFDSKRQYFLPNNTSIHSPENSKFLSDFIRENQINTLINQEGNVNMCIPFEGKENIRVFTCLHFNPNYIDNKHFFYKFSNSKTPIRQIAQTIFSIKIINSVALKYLRNKLSKNYRKNLEWCDKFILLSSRFQKELTGLVGRVPDLIKVESIHNPNTLTPECSKNKENIILYVGRLDNSFKRVDTIIDNVSRVLRKNPQWRMVICGDGPDRESLIKKARETNTPIEFAGICDPTYYYKKASVIVLRSTMSEGWGMVLIEAMSYGVVPVVADTYASLKDIIDNETNGVITPDSDYAFSSALDGLIRESHRMQAMSYQAVKKAATFNIDDIVKEWYRLLSL